ncbi:hypothetical protein D6C77_03756 [Aureobasidium pullulans]|nr:hypothetical protein D6C77_03756 [Aureobasidium pullulans]
MEATLITPFNSYCTHVGFGAAGQVLAISENAVFKGPILLDNPAPSQREIMEDAMKSIENEKTMHRMLQRHAHPNIIHSILVLPEGIFLERLGMSLAERLTPTALPVDPGLELRWIQQLVSAVAWLEGLGIAHGDLRPSNILLDTSQNLNLIDFDCAVKFGEELIAGGAPFCKMNNGFKSPAAGVETEVFAIGSCVYNIHFGHEPWSELNEVDGHEVAKKWCRHEYPPPGGDEIGVIIQRCWDGDFKSIRALDAVVKTLRSDGMVARRPSWLQAWFLVVDCRYFLAKDGLSMNKSLGARLRFLGWWGTHRCLSVAVKVERGFTIW